MPNQTSGAPSILAFRGCAGRPAPSQHSTNCRTEIGTADVAPIVWRRESQLRPLRDSSSRRRRGQFTKVGRLSVAHGRTLRRLLGKLLEVPIPRSLSVVYAAPGYARTPLVTRHVPVSDRNGDA